MGKAVKSLKQDYPAVLATLKLLDDHHHDAAAKGLFMRVDTFKFVSQSDVCTACNLYFKKKNT